VGRRLSKILRVGPRHLLAHTARVPSAPR
jgi:hypothetical protein